ncbi:hypothetical protein E4U55_002363 [Claviceps digitariae]|nr:hypothetical protein E4U55_002363 [Claviceps digitariae]
MAAVQPRTRPRVNVAAANSRSRPVTATALHHDTEPSHHAAAAPASSPLLVFLTNLRLLDLDLLPDWPDITADTFSANGIQGQKRRIQCVQWVLVNLFRIWDPEETCSKLNPFFPPHDQMQSVSLRAALMRALDTVKKNGFLGRDTVIRKTMLDDCKGERLEEVLAHFSTAVLRRVVQDDSRLGASQHHAIAVKLALETRGYNSDNTDLQALNLAYRTSLRRFLEEKQETRALYRDFGDLLNIKERGVRRRMEAIRAKESGSTQDTLSRNAKEEMRRLVRNNWSGNEKWMETLIKGDCHATETTGLLDMPFDRVWRRVQQGRLAEIENDSGGLLEQLDNRVKLQKDRLARWNTFRNSTFGQLSEAPFSPSKKKRDAEMRRPGRGIDFQFSSHHELQVGSTCQTLGASHWDREVKSKSSQSYDQLLRGLKDDLAGIKKVDSTVLNFLGRSEARRRSVGRSSLGCRSTDGGETISEMSELEDEPSYGEAGAMTAGIPVRTNRTKLDTLRRHPIKPQMPRSEVFNQSTSTQSSPPSPPRDEERTLRQDDFFIPPTDEFEELEPPPSPNQDSAEGILEAMDHASPSPVKRPRQRPTLSLAQRTRLSMAGNQSPFLDEEPELPLRRPLACANDADPTPPSEPDSMKGSSEPLDLVSRTRLSMAGFEQAQKKAQIERRKSLRKSKASVKKEVTCVEKVVEKEEGGLDREALTQELIVEEDMEAVFKSRPKMRTSPVGSPGKGW